MRYLIATRNGRGNEWYWLKESYFVSLSNRDERPVIFYTRDEAEEELSKLREIYKSFKDCYIVELNIK